MALRAVRAEHLKIALTVSLIASAFLTYFLDGRLAIVAVAWGTLTNTVWLWHDKIEA